MSGWITLGAIVLIIAYFISVYNRLVSLRNRYQNAFAQIEVQLKRRYDLIPNLIETAKGYLKHEAETLEAVVAARNKALNELTSAAQDPGSASQLAQLAGAEGALGAALGKLSVVVKGYPELKADQNMRQLSEELSSTENKVAFSRQAFNDSVMMYNEYRQSFPNIIIANKCGHRKDAVLLEFEDSEAIQAAPQVKF